MMPSPQDPELFSFWVSLSTFFNSYMAFVTLYAILDVCLSFQLAGLSNRRPPERLDLLHIRDTKEVGIEHIPKVLQNCGMFLEGGEISSHIMPD